MTVNQTQFKNLSRDSVKQFRALETLLLQRGWFQASGAFDEDHTYFPAPHFPEECHNREHDMSCYAYYPGDSLLSGDAPAERVLIGFSAPGCSYDIDSETEIAMQYRDIDGVWQTRMTMSRMDLIKAIEGNSNLAPVCQSPRVRRFFDMALKLGATQNISSRSTFSTLSLRSRDNGVSAGANNVILTFDSSQGSPTVTVSKRVYQPRMNDKTGRPHYDQHIVMPKFTHIPLHEIDVDLFTQNVTAAVRGVKPTSEAIQVEPKESARPRPRNLFRLWR